MTRIPLSEAGVIVRPQLTTTGIVPSGNRAVISLKHLPLGLITVPPKADVELPLPQSQIGQGDVW